METNKNEQKEQTLFEKLLSKMSLEEKNQVFTSLMTVYHLFKDYTERAGGNWIATVAIDEPLRNIFTCATVAGEMWFNEQREKELQNENQEP